MGYDLVLYGGRVFESSTKSWRRLDVAIRGDRVAALAPDIPTQNAKWSADVSGLSISPGFVDLHMHTYWGATFWGIQADVVCPRAGVTTAVDAGSAGAFNFPGFHTYVTARDVTRSLAFINISGIGLVGPGHELTHPGFADVDATVEMGERFADTIVGVKVRVAPDIVGDQFRSAMAKAREAADALKKPLMVHIATQPPTLGEILDYLRPGDIIAHCFTARANKIVDDELVLRDADGGQRTAELRLRNHLTVTGGKITFADERVHLVPNEAMGGNPAVTGEPTITG